MTSQEFTQVMRARFEARGWGDRVSTGWLGVGVKVDVLDGQVTVQALEHCMCELVRELSVNADRVGFCNDGHGNVTVWLSDGIPYKDDRLGARPLWRRRGWTSGRKPNPWRV